MTKQQRKKIEREFYGYTRNRQKSAEEVRKETAKEFAEKLKEKAYTNNYCQEVILKSEIDELLKEYGVEVEE